MKSPTSHELEFLLARVLRFGVLLAGVFILIGWLYQLDASENAIAALSTYQQQPFQRSLNEVWSNRDWDLVVCYLGLIILISLPLIRVMVTGFIFLKTRAYALAFLTLLVLSGLILSFSLGFEI